jgi:hypothetical protein
LWTAYDQISRGEAPTLLPKTAAFGQWIDRSIDEARGEAHIRFPGFGEKHLDLSLAPIKRA